MSGKVKNKAFLSSRFKFFLISLVVTFVLSVLIRSFNLTSLPIFADEAIYIRWAQLIKSEPTLRFIPLSDGKQPLFMWLNWQTVGFFTDPLVSGRIISVLSGSVTVVLAGLISLSLFRSKKAAIAASIMASFSPYLFFFDRLAVVDSLLTMFLMFVFLLSFWTVKTRRLDLAMIAGFFMGAALLTKSPAYIFLAVMPAFALFSIKNFKPKRQEIFEFLYSLLLIGVSVFIALSMYQVLRLGPNFDMIAQRNLDYVYKPQDILTSQAHIKSNLIRFVDWLIKLLPLPFLLLFAASAVNSIRKRKFLKECALLLLIITFSVLVTSSLSKAYTARYVLFVIPLILVFASSHFASVKRVFLPWLIIIVGLIYSLWFNLMLMFAPANAPLPENERSGYVEEWTAGWGIREAADYIRQVRKTTDQGIVLGTEGHFGTLPEGAQLYLTGVPNLTIFGIGLDVKGVRSDLVNAKRTGNIVFLAINQSRKNPEFSDRGLKTVIRVEKPKRSVGSHDFVKWGENDTFFLYEVIDPDLVQFVQ